MMPLTRVIGTTQSIQRKLAAMDERAPDLAELQKAYRLALKLRSQLLGLIYDLEQCTGKTAASPLANELCDGAIEEGSVLLTVHEPLPHMKEDTPALHEHWLELIHMAIAKAAQSAPLPHFEKAMVAIEIVTPRGTNNNRIWDTSNRAINLIINNLKGIFFADDDFEHMAFSVAARWENDGEVGCTMVKIHVWDQQS